MFIYIFHLLSVIRGLLQTQFRVFETIQIFIRCYNPVYTPQYIRSGDTSVYSEITSKYTNLYKKRYLQKPLPEPPNLIRKIAGYVQ